MLLAKKNVIITGASGGIGLAIAELFAEQGANICLVDINNNINQISEKLNSKHKSSNFESHILNLTKIEEIDHFFSKLESSSFNKVDILINNAGIFQTKPFLEITDEEWDNTFKINLKPMFILSKKVIPKMIEGGGGSILNMASIAGRSGRTYSPHYAASKAGVISLTKSIAEAFGKNGIRANSLCPGIIKTSMIEEIIRNRQKIEGVDENSIEQEYISKIPMDRLGTAEEIADAALMLCSNRAGYINGQAINVCGGYEMD